MARRRGEDGLGEPSSLGANDCFAGSGDGDVGELPALHHALGDLPGGPHCGREGRHAGQRREISRRGQCAGPIESGWSVGQSFSLGFVGSMVIPLSNCSKLTGRSHVWGWSFALAVYPLFLAESICRPVTAC